MKTVCIVQARLGSSRLPGKVLLPLNGHTVIGEVLTRCKRIPGVDEVVCAIPIEDFNTGLGRIVEDYGPVSYGPADDVLERYYRAAAWQRADIIVRVTGDCPLISPEACGALLAWFHLAGVDYIRSFNRDCEVFSRHALEQAHKHASEPEDREHVGPWMFRHLARAQATNLSLDDEEDYKVICAAFGHEPYADKRLQPAGSSNHPVGVAERA